MSDQENTKEIAAKKTRTKKIVEQESVPEKKVYSNAALFDWKSKVPDKYIEINSSWLAKNEISNYDDLPQEEKNSLKSLAGDENLLIRLAGFKHIAHLRGLSKVEHHRFNTEEGYVAVKCNIDFDEVEIDGVNFRPQSFSGLANATDENTVYPFKLFLESMAENRAFIRAVKSGLNINILGAEEINSSPKEITSSLLDEAPKSPQDSLKNVLAAKGKTFADLKDALLKKEWDGHEAWNDFKDIPTNDCLLIHETIVTKSTKKKEKTDGTANP